MSEYYNLRPRFLCWIFGHKPKGYKGMITLRGAMFTRCERCDEPIQLVGNGWD